MLQTLTHAWKVTGTISVRCPRGLPGKEIGYIATESVEAAYRLNALIWAAVIVAVVLACYLTASASLNRSFVVKWWMYWAAAVFLGLLVPLVVLSVAPLKLVSGSCGAYRAGMPVHMSFTQIFPSMEIWAIWALAAFPLLSLLFTRIAGWHPASRGFFHYRGCPWPRWNPFAS